MQQYNQHFFLYIQACRRKKNILNLQNEIFLTKKIWTTTNKIKKTEICFNTFVQNKIYMYDVLQFPYKIDSSFLRNMQCSNTISCPSYSVF